MAHVASSGEAAVVLPFRQACVRASVRFPIALSLTIDTVFGSFSGVTENISANGLLLVCPMLPEFVGAIEFTMAMPPEILGTETEIRIHCIGRIIRREQELHRVKVAIVIDEYFLKA